MNLVLLDTADFVSTTRVRVTGRRLEHVRAVHRAEVGQTLLVGRLDGPLGRGHIRKLDATALELDVELDQEPPPPLPLTLVVALPRPPSVRKILQQGSALGIKEFVFYGSRRVEKSYWQSKSLRPPAIEHELRLGLEQARDTRLPVVRTERRLGPLCDALAKSEHPILLADADQGEPCPRATRDHHVLVLGPEGGLLPFEIERFLALGARRITLGPRVLRVETAVVALCGRLF